MQTLDLLNASFKNIPNPQDQESIDPSHPPPLLNFDKNGKGEKMTAKFDKKSEAGHP